MGQIRSFVVRSFSQIIPNVQWDSVFSVRLRDKIHLKKGMARYSW